MNSFTKKVLDWVWIWLWFVLIFFITGVSYAVWVNMTDVWPWETLTNTMWNTMLWNIDTLKTDLDTANSNISTLQTNSAPITSTWWNVWIWVSIPTQKLDVSWTVKATQFESTKASFIRVKVNWCSWACSWYHTLDTWTNIAPIISHDIINNDASTFTTSWTNWTVTINKSWTYMIRINLMQVPSVDAWNNYAIPIINWSPNWLWAMSWEQAVHKYMKAGYWSSSNHTFIGNLSAWTTVWYAYYPHWTLTYWAYDNYTGMEIIKLN